MPIEKRGSVRVCVPNGDRPGSGLTRGPLAGEWVSNQGATTVATEQRFAVGAHCDGTHGPRVTISRARFVRGSHTPRANAAIFGARDRGASVSGKSDAAHFPRVSVEPTRQGARAEIIEERRRVRRDDGRVSGSRHGKRGDVSEAGNASALARI